MVSTKLDRHFACHLSPLAVAPIYVFHKLFLSVIMSVFFLDNASKLCFNYTYVGIKDTELQSKCNYTHPMEQSPS